MRGSVGFESYKDFATFVLRDKPCGQIPHMRVAGERWAQTKKMKL